MNITPRPDGEMMDWFYRVCSEMAGWMEHSREAVVGVNLKAPLPMLDKTENPTTVKGNVWYAQPDNRGVVSIRDVKPPLSVTFLRTGEELESEFNHGTLKVVVPESMRTDLPDLVKLVFNKG